MALLRTGKSFSESAVCLPSNGGVANTTADGTEYKPGYSLRLIQAVGILLPLFTGLLRLTTSEQSGVSEDLNTELLYGIMTLVLGGAVAVGGLITTDVSNVLKFALFFILLTFGIIGLAATRIYTETAEEDESGRPHPAESERNAEEPALDRIRSLLAGASRRFEEDPSSGSDREPEEGEPDGSTEIEDDTATREDTADDE